VRRAVLTCSVALFACGATPTRATPIKVEAPKAAACIEKEVAIKGQPPSVYRYLFDDGGNVLSYEDIHGGAFLSFRRARTGHMLSYEMKQGRVTASGKFSFGRRGELASLRLTSTSGYLDAAAELEWVGTFSKSKGVTLPFARLGGAGGAMYDHALDILSSNLNVRHASNVMPPVSFTGTVTITKVEGSSETYEYERGRLQRWRDSRGGEATYRWDDGPLPVEERWCKVDLLDETPRCGSATRAVQPSGDERVVVGGEGGAFVMDYDANGREVRAYGGPAGVETVSWHGCESFKPLRSP
jgi:hypothetical protein